MESFISGDAVIYFEATEIFPNRPTLVFVNSLGTDFRIWNDVRAELRDDFNIVLHDKRGHGLSSLGTDLCSIAAYAADLANLLDRLAVKSAIAVGLSVGGLIVQSLYHARPDLVSKLVISNSAMKIGNEQSWDQRIATVEHGGLEGLSDAIMQMWFSSEFRHQAPNKLSLYRTMLARSFPSGYIACCKALRDADLRERALRIEVPTLFIGCDQDGSTPASLVKSSAELVRNSQFVLIEGAAHIPCVETPQHYASLLKRFSESV